MGRAMPPVLGWAAVTGTAPPAAAAPVFLTPAYVSDAGEDAFEPQVVIDPSGNEGRAEVPFKRINPSQLPAKGVKFSGCPKKKKKGKGFHFTSTELAGSYSLVTNGLNDKGGEYVFSHSEPIEGGKRCFVKHKDGGDPISFEARLRLDTPREREYFRHGGILLYVLRQLRDAE